MKYSRFRTLLFTFTLGLATANIYASLSEYLKEIPVNLPKVESKTPIIIRLCPESFVYGIGSKYYREKGKIYFSEEKALDCNAGGGSGAL